MTSSPFWTLRAARLPSSRSLPGPTAITLPCCGFCLALSGSRMPPAVFSSASRPSTTTRSSSGLRFSGASFVFAMMMLRYRCEVVCIGGTPRAVRPWAFASSLHHPAHATHAAHPTHATHLIVVVMVVATFLLRLRDVGDQALARQQQG